ncbi:hypothetical protein [Streptomyces jeddahensis]|nr:hypothetical protein [Streptomyces jeddahensis]
MGIWFRRAVWVGLALLPVVLYLLLQVMGLDDADRLAGVLSLVVALAALVMQWLTYAQQRGNRPNPTVSVIKEQLTPSGSGDRNTTVNIGSATTDRTSGNTGHIRQTVINIRTGSLSALCVMAMLLISGVAPQWLGGERDGQGDVSDAAPGESSGASPSTTDAAPSGDRPSSSGAPSADGPAAASVTSCRGGAPVPKHDILFDPCITRSDRAVSLYVKVRGDIVTADKPVTRWIWVWLYNVDSKEKHALRHCSMAIDTKPTRCGPFTVTPPEPGTYVTAVEVTLDDTSPAAWSDESLAGTQSGGVTWLG